jgi:DNA-binding NtrC family response regulator
MLERPCAGGKAGLSDINQIVCISSLRSFRLLSKSILLDEHFWIVRESEIPKTIPKKIVLLLLEVEPSSRGLSDLRELVRLDSKVEIITFSFDGNVRIAVDSIRAGASNHFSLPDEIEALKKHVFESVRQKQKSDAYLLPILLRGETGTGKELLARAIHYNSERPDEPFVEVNCGTIPDTLLESELSGHEKGAFTGADSMKRGLFEIADKGTLFLDEIAELDPTLQVKLFNAIEYKTIRRIGGTKSPGTRSTSFT